MGLLPERALELPNRAQSSGGEDNAGGAALGPGATPGGVGFAGDGGAAAGAAAAPVTSPTRRLKHIVD